MVFAYADPPYPGQAKKHYSHDPLCAEVDHAELIEQMTSEYDGWALSTNSTTLQMVLPLCPEGVRVGAWVKPFAIFKPGVNPGYTWEPLILWNGRKLGRDTDTIRDHIAESVTLRRGLVGVKPDRFCYWLFEFAGLKPSDQFVDLFPGSGAVSRAWAAWCKRKTGAPIQIGLFKEDNHDA